MNLVKVTKLGETVTEVSLVEGATLNDALVAAEMSVEGMKVSVNSRDHELDAEVYNGDIVVLTPKIEGGAE
jgi:hypothetical protein